MKVMIIEVTVVVMMEMYILVVMIIMMMKMVMMEILVSIVMMMVLVMMMMIAKSLFTLVNATLQGWSARHIPLYVCKSSRVAQQFLFLFKISDP